MYFDQSYKRIKSQPFVIHFSDKATHSIHYNSLDHSMQKWPQNEVLGFSNSLPLEPYTKTTAGIEMFREIVNERNQSQEKLVKNLINFLSDRTKYLPDKQLSELPLPWSDALTAICTAIPEEIYGTRFYF